MIKVLLTSDMHIGADDGNMPVTDPVRIGTFRKICSLAKDHQLLVIAGDLFHHGDITKRELELVAEEFKQLRDHNVEILYAPGEHEYTHDGSLPGWLGQINLTRVFTGEDPETPYEYEYKSQRINIYGLPAIQKGDRIPRRVEGPGFHMGLFHAEFIPENPPEDFRLFAITKKNLKSMNLDFYALGHRHNFKIFKSNNRIIAAYPGSPEAVSMDETGDRYVLSITVGSNEIQQIKRLAVNTLRIKKRDVLCEEVSGVSRLTDLLESEKSAHTVLTLTLKGRRAFPLIDGALERYSRDFHTLTIINESYPTMETLIEEFSDENSLRGEFYAFLKERLEQEGLPGNVDSESLVKILDRITRNRSYDPEEWVC